MIVIIAKEDDNHAAAVKQVLESKYDEKVFIFNTASFPTITRLSGHFGSGLFKFSLTDGQSRDMELQSAKSFWWRRPQGVLLAPHITDPQVRNFTFTECISAVYGMLRGCGDLWVNDVSSDDRADYKPYQLKTAVETGFTIPETLITNDPEKALDFWRRHEQKVVYKSFNQRGIIWCPTRLLKAEDLNFIRNVQYAPVIFQTLVPGNRDIRVTVIGEKIFATEFIIHDENIIDYRLVMRPESCRPHKLPEEMLDKLYRFMCALGLEYGGIDFRLTPEGEYVFFEINTAGEFMYLQELTGQPIADAMADHLSRGKRINVPIIPKNNGVSQ